MLKNATLLLFILFMLGCRTIDRWTTYSYYIFNEADDKARIIGFTNNEQNTNDTLVDTTIGKLENIQIYSGLDGFDAGATYNSLGIESCDSVFVFVGDICIGKFFNYRKYSLWNENESTTTLFYQFDNNAIWIPFEIIEYNGNGPQPKEIKHKFTIE